MYVHIFKSLITNVTKAQKEFDLIIVRKEEKVVNWRKQTIVVLCSIDTSCRNKEFYCFKRYATVLKEGDVADFLMYTSVNKRGSDKPAEFEGAPVLENLQHHTGSREDVLEESRIPS